MGLFTLVVVVRIGAGSKLAKGLEGALVELFTGTLVVVVAVNRGAVAAR